MKVPFLFHFIFFISYFKEKKGRYGVSNNFHNYLSVCLSITLALSIYLDKDDLTIYLSVCLSKMEIHSPLGFL